MPKKPFAQPSRGLLQTLVAGITLGLLAIPVIVVALSDSAGADPLWTALRIVGLEAFTVVSVNIVVGSFRPFFSRVLKPRLVLRMHRFAGMAGFALAVAHGICVLVFGVVGYNPGALWVGPIVLAFLAVVIATALLNSHFKRSWRWIHRLNYAIFVAVLVHGLILGSDLGSSLFLKVCAGVYTAVVLAGLANRAVQSTGTGKTAAKSEASAP